MYLVHRLIFNWIVLKLSLRGYATDLMLHIKSEAKKDMFFKNNGIRDRYKNERLPHQTSQMQKPEQLS